MWNFNKLLDIRGFHVKKFISGQSSITFVLSHRRISSHCPQCKQRSKKLHSYQQARTIRHGMVLGKKCNVVLTPRRFTCQTCSCVFTEPLSFLGSRQTATDKHKKEVIYNLADRSFQSGTKRYQVAYSTQRRWLKELVQDELYNFSREDTEKTPFTLGIDEVSFAEHTLVTTIGNITKRRLKGILPSRRKDDLKKVLHRIPSSVKPYIREVVIDMCELYARAIKEVLPHSSIVVDHFHVIQDANRRIDEERCILQDIYKKKIPRYIFTKNKEDLSIKEIVLRDILLIDYPELKVFYETKERLRSMYKLSSKKDAQDSMRHIISLLVSSDNGYHVLWGRSLSRWKEYILNYFDHRSTNGFMEGMHNKMKLIKRISFGFRNKEVFIHKVMLSVLITGILLPQLML